MAKKSSIDRGRPNRLNAGYFMEMFATTSGESNGGIHYSEEFPYTPPIIEPFLDTYPLLYELPDTEPKAGNNIEKESGINKFDRKLFKYILKFASGHIILDYEKGAKLGNKWESYKAYCKKNNVKVDEYVKKTDPETGEITEVLQEHYPFKGVGNKEGAKQAFIAKMVHETAVMLANKYILLDENIHDEYEEEEEDIFNYYGFSPFWRYANKSNTRDKVLKPEFNELSKWIYILDNMSDHELLIMKNPYIYELFTKKMFVHPSLGIVYKPNLESQVNRVDSKIVTNQLAKRFKTSIDNQEKLFKYLEEKEDNASKLTKLEKECYGLYNKAKVYDKSMKRARVGYLDGSDLMIGIRMYLLSLRLLSVGARKYRENPAMGEVAIFLGYASNGSLNVLSKNGLDDINEIDSFIDEIRRTMKIHQDKLLRDFNGDNSKFPHAIALEKLLDYMYKVRKSQLDFVEASKYIMLEISSVCEKILQNENARNVTGAVVTLKAQENSNWNERLPDAEPLTINVIVSDEFK